MDCVCMLHCSSRAFFQRWSGGYDLMENEREILLWKMKMCKIELISLRCWFIVAHFAVVMVFGVTDSKAA